jgi:hypothetical protein
LVGEELNAELEALQSGLASITAKVENELRDASRNGAFVSGLFRDLVDLMHQVICAL